MRYGIYIDFDNLIGGFKANLNIKEEKSLTSFQREFIPLLLKKFLQNLLNTYGYPRFKKVFAEYHNLPFRDLLKPQPFVFLNNIGMTPINPFVIGSSGDGKNKNASDISLTLEVVNDLILKNIPIDTVALFSGDIDFYPLISWIREHTEKNIYLISFSDRIKRNYIDIFFHLIGSEYIVPAEIFLIRALTASLDISVLRSELNSNSLNSLLAKLPQARDWLYEIINKLGDKKAIPSGISIKYQYKDAFDGLLYMLEKTINT